MPSRLSFFSLSGTFVLIVIRRTSRRDDVLVSLPTCPSLLRERTEWKEMVWIDSVLRCTTRFADLFAFVVLSPTNRKTRTAYARSNLRRSTACSSLRFHSYCLFAYSWLMSPLLQPTIIIIAWNHCLAIPDIDAVKITSESLSFILSILNRLDTRDGRVSDLSR